MSRISSAWWRNTGRLRCLRNHDPQGGWLAYRTTDGVHGQFTSRCARCHRFIDDSLPSNRWNEKWIEGLTAEVLMLVSTTPENDWVSLDAPPTLAEALAED